MQGVYGFSAPFRCRRLRGRSNHGTKPSCVLGQEIAHSKTAWNGSRAPLLLPRQRFAWADRPGKTAVFRECKRFGLTGGPSLTIEPRLSNNGLGTRPGLWARYRIVRR